MSNLIRPNYGTKAYSAAMTRGAKRAGVAGGFASLAAQGRTDTLKLSGGAKTAPASQPDSTALAAFKEEVWAEIDSMPWGSGVSVQITDDAFEKMMTDDSFKQKMMKIIQEDARGSNAMCGGTLIRIDANGYSGYSYMDSHAPAGKAAVETHSKSKAAFYTKKDPAGKADAVQNAQPRSEEEEMQQFKAEFYDDLSKIIKHPSVANTAVNISDAAFKAMKNDPEYRSKILSLLQRDMGASFAPTKCSLLITVGATLEEYRGDSWSVGHDSEFGLRSQDSFYKRSEGGNSRQKDFLEEYLEKKAQAKRLRQASLLEAALDKKAELARITQEQAQEKLYAGTAELLKARLAAGRKGWK